MRLLAALLLAALLPAPATANSDAALHFSAPRLFYVYAPGTGPGFDDQYLYPMVYVPHNGVLHDVVITVDASDLDGAISWKEESGECTGDGAVLTCDLGTLEQALDFGTFLASALPDSAPGDEGVVRFHATASDAAPLDRELRVVVGRPELAVARVPAPRDLRPGGALDVPVTVTNRGNVPAEGFGVEVALPDHVSVVPSGGSPCYYIQPSTGFGSHGYCLFRRRLDPGDEVRLTMPFHLRTDARLMYGDVDVVAFAGGTSTPIDLETRGSVPGTGPRVRLRPASGASYPGGVGISVLRLDTGGQADFAAFGDRLRGKVNQTVTVKVGTRNLGPGELDLTAKESEAYRLEFVPPEGTTVTSNPFPGEDDPWTCSPGEVGAQTYDCPPYLEAVPLHQRQTYVFRLRIDRRVPGAVGQVRVIPNDTHWSARDPDSTNDVADVVVKVHGRVPPPAPDNSDVEVDEVGNPDGSVWSIVLIGLGVLVGLFAATALALWRRTVVSRRE